MSLLAHQMQGSYTTCPLSPQPWTKGVKLKTFVAVKLNGRKCGYNSMKGCFHQSIMNRRPLHLPHRKPFKISSFKGNPASEKSEDRADDSKSSTASIKLSYTSQEKEETISPDTENLFKRWLILLRTQTFSQTTDEVLREKQPQGQISENQCETQTKQWKMRKFMKLALNNFLRLDAAIKLPLIIFVPFYLSVNIIYGAEVSKELTPMWVLGPLIISLYVMVIKGLCALYVFTFKKTVSLVKALPVISLGVYNYVAGGQLGAELRARFWQPVIDVKNMDYREWFKQKLKKLEEWIVESYLDYVESIWPYYCRTIRFLKKARLL